MEKQYTQLNVYVDGAYSPNYPERYSGAFVVVDPTKQQTIIEKYGCGTKAVSMRNVAGELSATMRAVQYVSKLTNSIVLFYDYTGIKFWVTDEWKANKPETQAYKDYMYKFKDKIQFVKVKAHSGDKYNTRVDQLAKYALMENRAWKD